MYIILIYYLWLGYLSFPNFIKFGNILNSNSGIRSGGRVIKSEKGGTRYEILFLSQLFCMQDFQRWWRVVKIIREEWASTEIFNCSLSLLEQDFR